MSITWVWNVFAFNSSLMDVDLSAFGSRSICTSYKFTGKHSRTNSSYSYSYCRIFNLKGCQRFHLHGLSLPKGLFPVCSICIILSASKNVLFLACFVNIEIFCNPPPAPSNGGVESSSGDTRVGTTATYYCNHDYVLVGMTTRTCVDTSGETIGTWSGTTPLCEGTNSKTL